jgi:hypothetical protein
LRISLSEGLGFGWFSGGYLFKVPEPARLAFGIADACAVTWRPFVQLLARVPFLLREAGIASPTLLLKI